MCSPRLAQTVTRLQRMRWSGTTDVVGGSRDFFVIFETGVTVGLSSSLLSGATWLEVSVQGLTQMTSFPEFQHGVAVLRLFNNGGHFLPEAVWPRAHGWDTIPLFPDVNSVSLDLQCFPVLLWCPLPLSSAFCRCGQPLDSRGHH